MIFNKKKFFLGFGTGFLGTLVLAIAGISIAYFYLLDSELETPAQAPKIDTAVLKKLRLKPVGTETTETIGLKPDKVYLISFFDPTDKDNLIQLPGIGDLQQKLKNKKVAFYLIGEGSMQRINKVADKFTRKLPIFQLQDSLPEIYNHELPKTFIVANNKIVFEHEGAANWNDSSVVNFINRQL